MNRMQWEAAIHRLRQMEERLPEGSFDRLALEQARKAAQSKISAKVRYGGGESLRELRPAIGIVNERRRNA